MRCAVILLFLLPFLVSAQDCDPVRAVNVMIQPTPAPSLPGQTVAIGVFVEPLMNSFDPTGTIQLSDGMTDLGAFNIFQGQIHTSRTFTDAGAHLLVATYSGDFNYCSKTSVFGQQVNRLTANITLASSATTAAFGAPVTLTAQNGTPTPAGVADPTGQFQFVEGTSVLGSVTPVKGKATLTLSNLSAGAHQITAVMVGDFNWFQVRSTPVSVTVNRAPTTIVLNAASGTSLSATVTSSAAGSILPGGTVQFVDASNSAVLGTAALPAGSSTATVTLGAGQLTAAAGHPITALYSGDTNFSPSTSNSLGLPAAINAAGATLSTFAPDELVSLFGSNFSTSTAQGTTVPLPTTVAGVGVTVTDSAGVARPAGIYLVSPAQINLVIPAATAPGTATIALTGTASAMIPIQITIGQVAPGLFTGAQLIRDRGDGKPVVETVTTAPITIGTDTVYLVLYGTGIRNRSSLASVFITMGGKVLPVVYAGSQTQFPGLDQVDLLLPATLNGAGKVSLTITVDGQASNTLTLTIQ